VRTLQEVARETGVDIAVLKKHVQRGKLRSVKDGARTMIEDDALEAYRTSEELAKVAEGVRGQPMATVTRDIGSLIAGMSQSARDQILRHLSSEPQRKPRQTVETNSVSAAAVDPKDVHFGFPIGYAHPNDPKWKRITASTWKLGGQKYSWNGLFWEPDCVFGSPSNPDPRKRPQA
jgi:hypothetical protein